jgi:putative acetyltransferase
MTLRIRNVDPQGEVALTLLRDAADEIGPLYLGDSATGFPLPTNPPLGIREVYVAAWLEEVAVGCGAIRELDPGTAEIQRMYVHREYRRRQVARTILRHLENEASRLGYTRLLLETGNRQTPAMALYEASGFHRVRPFGRHINDPTSVCYERNLRLGV